MNKENYKEELDAELGETVEWLESQIKAKNAKQRERDGIGFGGIAETIAETCLELIITDASGIYIPKEFIEGRLDWQLAQIKAQTSEGTIEILKNPEHEHYWEAWIEVLDTVVFAMPFTGRKFSLHQDGDLWAIKLDELEKFSPEEIQEFWDTWL